MNTKMKQKTIETKEGEEKQLPFVITKKTTTQTTSSLLTSFCTNTE
jgi:hypothetical protein